MNRQTSLRTVTSLVLFALLAVGSLSSVPPAFGCGGSFGGAGCKAEQPGTEPTLASSLFALEQILAAIGVAIP